jgi:hypothetical protein
LAGFVAKFFELEEPPSAIDELGHEGSRAKWLVEEKRHQPCYVLANLDGKKVRKYLRP